MLKILSLKLMIESKSISIRIFLREVTMKMDQEKYLSLLLCRKVILGVIKLKI